MFCPNCGNNIPQGAAFCPGCGAASAPVASTPRTAYAPQTAYAPSNSPVKAKAMEIMGSPLFLIACIVAIVSFLFTAMGWFRPIDLGFLYSIPNGYRIVDEIPYEFFNIFPVLNIIGNIPTILEIIGVIILLCTLKSAKKNGGFTFLKIGLIMEFVVLAIIAAIVAVVFLVAVFAAAEADGAAAAALLVIFLVIVAAFVVGFMYIKGLISAVGIASDAINDDKCIKKPSMLVIVINFMAIAGSIISIFASLIMPGILATQFEMYAAYSFGASKVLVTVLEAATILLFTLVMIKGRSLAEVAKSAPAPSYANAYGIDMTGTTPITQARHCGYCGRVLNGDEQCNCQDQPAEVISGNNDNTVM